MVWEFLKSTTDRFRENLLDILYPPACILCHRPSYNSKKLCGGCIADIRPTTSRALPISSHRRIELYAAAAYDGPLVSLIHKKFSSDLAALDVLASLIIDMDIIPKIKPDYLVPVPLHWQRYATRGYNQAVEIARILHAHYNIPIASPLIRSKKTAFQKSLPQEERYKNLHQAFSVNPWYTYCNILKNKKILIIDDVCTTGATLINCAQSIIPLQPSLITALVAARATKASS